MLKPETQTAQSPFRVRDVPKFLVTTYVSLKAASVSGKIIADHSRFEEGDIIVRIGAAGIGVITATTLTPITDGVIDKTADFVNAKRAERKTKREAKKAEKNAEKKDQ